MKRYFTVVSMVCWVVLAGIAGATAQEAQKANPATDFEYDLNESGDGVVIYKYKSTATEVIIPAVIEDFPVVRIASEAFSGTNIVSIVFPDSVTSIGDKCCQYCEFLTKVVLPKTLTYIPPRMFESCTSLKEFTLPEGIKEIASGAFAGSGLEAIEIPDSVKEIGDWSPFYEDSNKGVFADCQNLKTVTVGNGIEVISTQAFSGCKNLTAVMIGSKIRYVEESAFSDCTNLATVTIGSGIRVIGNCAFSNCTSLTTVNIGAENVKYENNYNGRGAFSGCSALSLKEKQKLRKTGYTGGF